MFVDGNQQHPSHLSSLPILESSIVKIQTLFKKKVPLLVSASSGGGGMALSFSDCQPGHLICIKYQEGFTFNALSSQGPL
jgi:hypothetical protein